MIRFAIIGCGRIFNRHYNAIRTQPDAQIILLCDPDAKKVQALAKKHNVPFETGYANVLKNKNIDAVDICSPSGMHAKQGIMALKLGKHVLVEKPMAINSLDAEKMIKTARKYKQKLCVVLQNRYNTPMQELKKVVEEGKLGKIHLANVRVWWYRPQSYYADSWHGTKNMDGGILMNQAIHHIDALVWLLGLPKSVYCKTGTFAHRIETEDTALAILTYPNALASIEATTSAWPRNLEGSIALFGEKGSIKIGGPALNKKEIWEIKGEPIPHLTSGKAKNPEDVYGSSHEHVLRDFIDSIIKNREPKTNGLEGIKSLQVVEALCKSAKKNREIFL